MDRNIGRIGAFRAGIVRKISEPPGTDLLVLKARPEPKSWTLTGDLCACVKQELSKSRRPPRSGRFAQTSVELSGGSGG